MYIGQIYMRVFDSRYLYITRSMDFHRNPFAPTKLMPENKYSSCVYLFRPTL